MLSNIIFGFLKIAGLRRRVIFYLKQKYFQDFGFEIIVGQALVAPLPYKESYDSFSEIFLQNEYFDLLQGIELPHKWLDIGCHMGYFSLFLERLRRLSGITKKSSALLIDADSRSKTAASRLIERNNLSNNWIYKHGAIGKTKDSITFYENDYMSSTTLKGTDGIPVQVDICKEQDIKLTLNGNYDLVKVDIEGSEWEFLEYYKGILENTRYLILEWHSWHCGGGGLNQLKAKIIDLGFHISGESKIHALEKSKERQVGLILAKKKC